MAEGYSYDEAVRVLRYRQRNTYTASSMSFGNLDVQSVAWTDFGSPHRPTPTPAGSYYAQTSSFYENTNPYTIPPPREVRDDQLEIALRLSMEEENRRRSRVSGSLSFPFDALPLTWCR